MGNGIRRYLCVFITTFVISLTITIHKGYSQEEEDLTIQEEEQGLTVEQYYELMPKVYNIFVNEWREKSFVLEQYTGNPDLFESMEREITEEYDKQRKVIYDSYETDAVSFTCYRNKHKKEVDDYLTSHPVINQELQDLITIMQDKIEVFEEIKSNLAVQ